MWKTAPPTEKFRKDWEAFPYIVDELSLEVDLGVETTTVLSTLRVRPAGNGSAAIVPLVLDGMMFLDLLYARPHIRLM